MKIFLLSLVVVGLCVFGMCFNIIFRKKDFPDGEISRNKELRKLRGTQGATRLERVRRAVQSLGQHLDGQLKPPGLKRLPPAVREILRLLRICVIRHNLSLLGSHSFF